MRHVFGMALFGTAVLASYNMAAAHFLWLDTQTGPDGAHHARLIFSELPQPAGRGLSAKVSHSKLWSRASDGKVADLSFTPGTAADAKTLVATVAAQNGLCIEASCDYGVYAHGAENVLLHYYAKALPHDWQQCGDGFARSTRLELDVVPRRKDRTLALDVLFRNEKAVGREVIVVSPSGEEHKLKTDAQGTAVYEGTEAGHYAVRAGYIEADNSGQRDGKNYGQIWTYCTATFELGATARFGGLPSRKALSGDSKTSATAPSPSAPEALAAARAARSVWTKKFPGLSAEASVTVDSEKQSGKLKIDGDGTVTLTMPDREGLGGHGPPNPAVTDWARDQLESMVQHRIYPMAA
jgi:hypothetical protein